MLCWEVDSLDSGFWGVGIWIWWLGGVDSGVLVFWGSGSGLGGGKCNSTVCNF